MAHYAELDATNTVLQVLSIHNDVTYLNGVEHEQQGIDFLNGLYPESGTWVQTSYNHKIRTRYASVGGTYDASIDAFLTPKPFASWTLDENHVWEAPVPYPADSSAEDDPVYDWDEDTTSWIEAEAS